MASHAMGRYTRLEDLAVHIHAARAAAPPAAWVMQLGGRSVDVPTDAGLARSMAM
jgi:hypothetical protein